MISQQRLKEIADNADAQALTGIWHQISYDADDFLEKKEIFLFIIFNLLKAGKIKLHSEGVFIDSCVDIQIENFRDAWPVSESASKYEDFYWWFFDSSCPAGVAWRDRDGKYVIAD